MIQGEDAIVIISNKYMITMLYDMFICTFKGVYAELQHMEDTEQPPRDVSTYEHIDLPPREASTYEHVDQV